tara:strand:+ start:244 stop:654 length:411 start_codon:yes stop_codon:yes gene_type:complete
MNTIKKEIATTPTVAKKPQLSEARSAELLAKINSGGSVSRSGKFSVGADIDDIGNVTRQPSLYAGMVIALGGSATPTEVDKFAETSTGLLTWCKKNGDLYDQTPSKIMFGTYFDQVVGEEQWSNKKGKLEILRYTS